MVVEINNTSHQTQTNIHTNDVNKLRNLEYINSIQERVRGDVDAICNLTQKDQIYGAIDRYFSPSDLATKGINNFLRIHPHVYSDLIRIIHTFRNENGEFPEENIEDIKQVFLFRGRKEDEGHNIPGYIDQILKNKKFIKYCAKRNSILDIGSHDFTTSINEKQQASNVKKLIAAGMIENISGCTMDNINEHFLHTKNTILHYLGEVFGLYLGDIQWVQTIDDISKELCKLLGNNKGNDRKRAWKVVQAFHAWGDVSNIEEQYAKTRKACQKIPHKLREAGINIDESTIQVTENHQGAEIWNAQWNYKGILIQISWRAKTPKSVLKKLWETEEYVRGSAVRDELGLSFTYPDTIDPEMKKEIIIIGSLLQAKQGYLFKNKGELDTSEFTGLVNNLKKKPLFIGNKSGRDPKLCNASQSGFTRIGNESFGFEVQYSRQSAMEWKKKDDPVYKLKGSIDALIRGTHQASPKEIFNNLTREIKESDLKLLGVDSYNELMIRLIEGFNEGGSEIIFPYVGESNQKEPVVLFTTKTHKEIFEKKWNMKLLTKQDSENYQKMIDFINGLKQTH